ncbi:MAG: hypothetical protein II393_00985 [Cytophagales bacterium]|nr:hypothetical protein [Cytophagales bacterium]
MSNNMKFLLLNITLLAGMYCNCEYSRCADCCKNCCGNEDNKNENNNNDNSIQSSTQNNNLEQLVNLNNNNANDKNKNKVENGEEDNKNENNNNEVTEDNKGNSEENGEEGNNKKDNKNENNNNKEPEDKKFENKEINNQTNEEETKNQQVFKIEEGAIDNNLGCFGNKWFGEYQKKKNDNNKNTILLYKLTEQKNKEKTAGTLVYFKGNKKLKYTKGNGLPGNIKKSKQKWAIFKVTTLKEDNNKKQKGDSHIFYCSDVSTLNDCGLFEEVKCWSIKILAANTQGVETFYAMFYKTNSYLERCVTGNKKSGFIGLGKLNLSGAKNLSMMFYEALYKQKTVDSLKDWILKNGADISQMFYVGINNLVDKNVPDFRGLDKWIEKNNIYLKYSSGHKYSIFFKGYDNNKKNDKLLPKWYNDRLLKNSGKIESIEKINIYS